MMDSKAIEPVLEYPKDIKIEARRMRVYMLYMSGDITSQEGIAEALGISRDTVISDLEEMRKRISRNPPWDMEAIRQETYNRMVFLRQEVIQQARESKSPTEKPKLYKIAADMDEKILERYTQVGGAKPSQATDSEIGKAVVDYIKETFGAEQLSDFISWYDRRTKAKLAVAGI